MLTRPPKQAHVQQAVECKLAVDADEYVEQFRPELMEYAADWCMGTKFIQIQQRSDFFEVSIPFRPEWHSHRQGIFSDCCKSLSCMKIDWPVSGNTH